MARFVALALMCSLTPLASAQDDPFSDGPQSDQSESSAETKVGPADDEWSPKYKVVLRLSEDGLTRQVANTQNVDIPTVVYRSENHLIDGETVKRMVAVRRTERRQVQTIKTIHGTATLACDDFSMTTSTEKPTPDYSFECTGRCRLLLGGMIIDADSMKRENGTLTITNAVAQQQGLTMKSTSTHVDMQIFGVTTSSFGRPVGTLYAFELPISSPVDKSPQREVAPIPSPDSLFQDPRELEAKDSRPERRGVPEPTNLRSFSRFDEDTLPEPIREKAPSPRAP